MIGNEVQLVCHQSIDQFTKLTFILSQTNSSLGLSLQQFICAIRVVTEYTEMSCHIVNALNEV